MAEEGLRTTVVLPPDVLEMLRDVVPLRKRSEFIADAVRHRLMQMRWSRTCDRTCGVWRDEEHPDLRTPSDVNRYVSELRSNRLWGQPEAEEGE